MKEVKINKHVIFTEGGLILPNGLVQGDHYRFWPEEPLRGAARKYIRIQVCKNDFVVYNARFFIGSFSQVKKIQGECMALLGLNFNEM